MGKLTEGNPTARELVTEILDKDAWWSTLKVIVQFLHAKNIEQVRVEFGFVLERDLEGKPQAPSQIVQLSDLESLIKKGLDEGTIEWAGGSDFLFYPVGAEVTFMLCNDADLHFASTGTSLLLELGHKISSRGTKVYDSGHLI
ncbi:MAG TPA: hypothetical protein VGF61_14535 [Candidatus Acidoferrum sp.]